MLILDNVRSVENTASIFRTADGLGVKKIYLIGTTPTPLDRFGRPRSDFAKVSLGAETTVMWEYTKELMSLLKTLKNEGFNIISLEQDARSKDLKSFVAPEKFALVLGNEVDGVSKETLDLSNHILEIDMKGKKESLNVSVSAGIALYALLA
ncbi:MAG: tRNA/rRNA methyltransferase SpoU [Parcubacteria group bacterium]|nr:tRNA/rRNA methyltransferase SpoU [Parcubacteria group bacterium]